MSERDPFEHLGDLIDEPVMPRESFAEELRARLMSDLSASERSQKEHSQPMDIVMTPRPIAAFPSERARRFRPMAILELAAMAVLVLGLVAALSRSWFGNDPETPASVPAAVLQGDSTPVSGQSSATPSPTAVTTEATVAPPDDFVWSLTLPDGESLDFGGMLIKDGVIYRLLATPSFVGVQAVDSNSGTVKWQQAVQWAGTLFVLEEGTLLVDGGGNTLTAVDAETGQQRWQARLDGNPIAIDQDGNRLFVLTDTGTVAALDIQTGEELWSTPGNGAQTEPDVSTGMPAGNRIAVQGDIVAAINLEGVLTGFDVATGTERWTLEGYGPSASIMADNDRFIVIDGAGLAPAIGFGVGTAPESVAVAGTPGGASAVGPASVTTGAAGPGQGCGAIFGEAGGPSGATGGMNTSGEQHGGDPGGTTKAEAIVSGMNGTPFRVQGIDPQTGEIIWAQQTTLGMTITTEQGSIPPDAPMETCNVNIENGSVTSVTVSGSAVSGSASGEAGHVSVGSVSGGVFTPGQAFEGGSPSTIGIGVASFEGMDEPVIAIATDESGTYLQLQNGTLVKVEGGQAPGEEGHQESSEADNSSGTPESEDD